MIIGWKALQVSYPGKVGDVCLLCLMLTFTTLIHFLDNWTKLLKVRTGATSAPEWFYYGFDWWDLSFHSEWYESFEIPYVTLICSSHIPSISGGYWEYAPSCWRRTVSLVLRIEFCWSRVLGILYYLVSDMFFSWLWWLSFLEKWSEFWLFTNVVQFLE